MIRGAIFDADGTLLDSMGMWDSAGERYLATLGIPAPPDLRAALFPLSLNQCAGYLKERFQLPKAPEEIAKGINDTIRRFYRQEVLAKPGAVEFLKALKDRHVGLYLATNTDRTMITMGLERTGLLPLLDGLVTCGDLGTDKRTPTIFHYARRQLGTAVEDTWVFEDAVHAARTASQAGYPVAGVADPYSDQRALQDICQIYLPDLTDFSAFYRLAEQKI